MQSDSPVPVFSCWNGIVVFKADPVLPIHLRSNHTLSNDPLSFALPASHPAAHDPSLRGPTPALTPPIRFRASIPGECLSSESFLLPYDFRRVFDMQRIFTNPRVIVAYDWRYVSNLDTLQRRRFRSPLLLDVAVDDIIPETDHGYVTGFTCTSSGS
jgi:hypothetical protein